MATIGSKFRNRIHTAFRNVRNKLNETSSNIPRGISTSNIKKNKNLYKCGGFKNRH